MNADAYRSIARFFPAFDSVLEFFMPQIRRDLIALLKARGLHRILDLGCGTGDLSRRLADAGLSPVCLDRSESMLKRARGTAAPAPSFPLVLSDGGSLPFEPRFDAAVLRFVFHEMDPKTRESAWTEMIRVVRPGGLLVLIDFTVPDQTDIAASIGAGFIRLIESQMNRIHPPHFHNYQTYMKEGGTIGWIRKHGGNICCRHQYVWGNLGLIAVER